MADALSREEWRNDKRTGEKKSTTRSTTVMPDKLGISLAAGDVEGMPPQREGQLGSCRKSTERVEL